jgi:ABC-type nitrate/sulfonate/bicarbonate transport system permease component
MSDITKFAGLLSILAGLALWELVSRMVVANALFLAAPTQIFRRHLRDRRP